MDTKWKAKLDVLKHKLQMARSLEAHLNTVVGLKEETKKEKEEKTTEEKTIEDRKTIREKALINAIANIPAYKSATYYQLSLATKQSKNIELQPGVKTAIHLHTLKMAKRRLGQILKKLLQDMNNSDK